MSDRTWRQEAESHARREFPREACGLVVVHKGRERYVACRNLAADSEDRFELDPEDYANAEAMGEVVGVFHSHPNAEARPSAADLSACRASGVRWYIVSLPSGTWVEIDPEVKKQPLYGREFVHGLWDCYGFCRDWYASEMGIELPDFVRRDDWWKLGDNLYVENFAKAGFVEISPGKLRRGDALLMQVGANVPNHAAIYLGDDQIGHHLYGRLSSREVYGGYYKKHTTHYLRYVGNVA